MAVANSVALSCLKYSKKKTVSNYTLLKLLYLYHEKNFIFGEDKNQ